MVKKLIGKKMILPLLSLPGVNFTNTSIKENLTNSEIQLKTLKKLVEKYNLDGIFTFMDLTVEAESLGLEINFPENDNPSVADHPVKNRQDFEKIKNNWHGIDKRMKVFVNLIKKMNKEFKIFKSAYVIGPFTLAGELMGPTDVATNVFLKPKLLKEILEFSVDIISEYTEALFKAGADAVTVLEPTAVILSPAQYEEFSQYYFQKIYKNVNKKPLILHICGNTIHLLPIMAKSNAAGFSLDSQVDFEKASEVIEDDTLLIGNIDPTDVFLMGDNDIIEGSVKKLSEKMKGKDNFILSSGCDIPLKTTEKNIRSFLKYGEKYINN